MKKVRQKNQFEEHCGDFGAWFVTDPTERRALDNPKSSTKKIFALAKIILFPQTDFFRGLSQTRNSGQAMLTMVLFFLFLSLSIVLGIVTPILKQANISRNLIRSTEAYYIAQSGLEDVYSRLQWNKQVAGTEVVTLNNGTASVVTTNTASGKQLVSTGTSLDGNVRKLQLNAQLGTGISFFYGIQSGQGGFVMQNSSSIIGNVFSAGSVTGVGNYIYGDVVSAGASGLIDMVHATGSAYAHNIRKSGSSSTIIDRNAYYVNKDAGVTVSGTLYPNSADQSAVDLPISDAQISEWESDAAAGGSVTCSSGSYTISSDTSIGPKKIPCNLAINGTAGGITVTVTGPLWVTGNITSTNKSTIKMSSSLGSQNVAVIADNPSNQSGSGIINLNQNTTFQGSGSAGSYVFMISQNNSAETGGSTDAIAMNQGASALVAYASHGQITLSQSISVKEVTAYKIILKNSANVTYDTGLPSVLFEAGPSGGYQITSWAETQ